MAGATIAVAQILMRKSRFKRERRNCRANVDAREQARMEKRAGIETSVRPKKAKIPNVRDYLTNSSHSSSPNTNQLLIPR
jgi:hypothetical protein